MFFSPAYDLEVILNSLFSVNINTLEIIEHILHNVGMCEEQNNNESGHNLATHILSALLYALENIPETKTAQC
jgi:hypothetical protein